jgi:hypothetical protein
MSVDAGFSILLVSGGGPKAVLDALMKSTWQGHQEGWWCVPLNEDPSEWILLERKNAAEVVALFQAKMSAEQVFGLRLWWEGGEVGGEFLVFPNCEVTFSPTINRVTIGDRTTDVSWYLSRLLPLFREAHGIAIESWAWRETG